MPDIGAKQRHSMLIFMLKEMDALSLVGEASFSLCFFKETIVMMILITVTPILTIPITFIGISPVIKLLGIQVNTHLLVPLLTSIKK